MPIPSMKGAGWEHPLSGATTHSQKVKDHASGPARIITQTNRCKCTVSSRKTTLMHSAKSAGGHKFIGVIAHDQSRPSTHPGTNDHFKVKPTFRRT